MSAKWAEFLYNGLGQFSGINRGTSVDPVIATTYEYDAFTRLAALTHKLGAGESSSGAPNDVVAGYAYAYDAASRITTFTNTLHSSETATFSYDWTNQLTGADRTGSSNDESYDYDANGNRDSSGYVTGAHNRTTADGEFTYAYDDHGRRVSRIRTAGVAAEGDWLLYQWDHRGRLASVVFKDSVGDVTKIVRYEYDPFDRLIARLVDSTPGSYYEFDFADATAQRFVYDGNQVVLAFAGTNGSGWDLTTRYVWGPQVDQLLAQENFDATNNEVDALSWMGTDHQNTVRDVWDAGGTLIAHFAYDSFGKLLSAVDGSSTPIPDATVVTAFLYTGRWFDAVVSAQYNLFRWYDPHLGKWFREDPIGFGGGLMNLRSYVGNNPVNRFDPIGLASLPHDTLHLGGGVGDLNSIELESQHIDIDFAPNNTPKLDGPKSGRVAFDIRRHNSFGGFSIFIEHEQRANKGVRFMVAFTPKNTIAAPACIELVQIVRAWENGKIYRPPSRSAWGDDQKAYLTNHTYTSIGWHVDHIPARFINSPGSASLYYRDSAPQSFVDYTPPQELTRNAAYWGQSKQGYLGKYGQPEDAVISDAPSYFDRIEFEVTARNTATGESYGSVQFGYDVKQLSRYHYDLYVEPYARMATDVPSRNMQQSIRKFNLFYGTQHAE